MKLKNGFYDTNFKHQHSVALVRRQKPALIPNKDLTKPNFSFPENLYIHGNNTPLYIRVHVLPTQWVGVPYWDMGVPECKTAIYSSSSQNDPSRPLRSSLFLSICQARSTIMSQDGRSPCDPQRSATVCHYEVDKS